MPAAMHAYPAPAASLPLALMWMRGCPISSSIDWIAERHLDRVTSVRLISESLAGLYTVINN